MKSLAYWNPNLFATQAILLCCINQKVAGGNYIAIESVAWFCHVKSFSLSGFLLSYINRFSFVYVITRKRLGVMIRGRFRRVYNATAARASMAVNRGGGGGGGEVVAAHATNVQQTCNQCWASVGEKC